MIDLDHKYFTDQPLEQKLSRKVTTLKKKVNHLQKTVARKNEKVKNMKELLKALKEKRCITDEHLTNLSENSDVAKSLFKNQIEDSKKDSTYAQYYNLETKQSATTLLYKSPQAYDFVKVMKLPHASSIRAWAASAHCQPGYLTNFMELIGNLVDLKKMDERCVMNCQSISSI